MGMQEPPLSLPAAACEWICSASRSEDLGNAEAMYSGFRNALKAAVATRNTHARTRTGGRGRHTYLHARTLFGVAFEVLGMTL